MCRLYAQISAKPLNAADFLAEADHSLLRQANYRRKDYQQDGWGIGYYAAGGAKVVKSPKAVFKEAARFRSLSAQIKSRVVIGHLRAASNPLRLSQSKLMGYENTQPFTDGRFIFAHNGTVQIPLEVAKFLGPYAASVRGLNDSEIFFWQFRKFYDLYGNIPEALTACVHELWTLWDYCQDRYRKKKLPYIGLNTLVSDGRSLHGLCHYPAGHPKLSLYDPKQPWGRMTYARRGDRVILASERLDAGSWSAFGNPQIISATLTSGGIKVAKQTFSPKPD